jgi:hypothetical protein
VLATLLSEIKRWALQLLMAFASIFYAGSIGVVAEAIQRRMNYEQSRWVQSFAVLLMLIAYYALSTYFHYRYDKAKPLSSSPIVSPRPYVLCLFITLFLVASNFLGSSIAPDCHLHYKSVLPNHVVDNFFGPCNPFWLFSLCSIVLTWWLSELYLRFKNFRQRRLDKS